MLSDLNNYLKDKQMADVATVEGLQARVRPMTLMWYKEQLWLATGSEDAKTAQLRMNPLLEVVTHLKQENFSGYIRISGSAMPVTDPSMRKEIADFSGFIYNYWSDPNDPGYALFRIDPLLVKLMQPGDMLESVLYQL